MVSTFSVLHNIMFSRTTRSKANRLQTIASRLGFTNEIREVKCLTDNPNMVIIVEQQSSDTEQTRIVIMNLTGQPTIYNKQFIGFPESLEDKTLTIDDDGEYIHLVISGPRTGVYFTLSPSQIQTAA